MESKVDLLQCIRPNADSSVVPGRCNFRVGGSTHQIRIVPSSLVAADVVFFGPSSSLVVPVRTVEGFAKAVVSSRNPYFGGVAGSPSVRLGFVGKCAY